MMNYEEFKAALLKDLRNIDYQSKGLNVLIGNLGSIKGYKDAVTASVKLRGSTLVMAADLTSLYKVYKEGSSYAEILKDARESIESLGSIPEVHSEIMIWDVMKDKVEAVLRCKEGNGRLLSKTVHHFIEDMSLLYTFRLSEDEKSKSVGYVSKDMLKVWDITEEELRKVAIENTEKNHPAKIEGLVGFMASVQGIELPGDFEEYAWILGNENKTMGAVTITYPGLLDKVADHLGDDLLIIPSSVHEVIVMKEHGVYRSDGMEDLPEFIMNTNREYLSRNEKLSDQPYHYDRAAHKLETVSHWKERVGKTA